MNPRILVALILPLITACDSTPTLPGDWDGKTLHDMDGNTESVALPYEECSTTEGNGEYCTTMDFYLKINDDFTGLMTTETQMGTMELTIDIAQLEDNAYTILANVMDTEEMILDCILHDANNMTCNFEIFGFDVDFEKL